MKKEVRDQSEAIKISAQVAPKNKSGMRWHIIVPSREVVAFGSSDYFANDEAQLVDAIVKISKIKLSRLGKDRQDRRKA